MMCTPFSVIFLVAILLSCSYGQKQKYEYVNFGGYESFEINQDSFLYEHSAGLIFGKVTGTIHHASDETLIFNSDIQPVYPIEKSYNDTLTSGKIAITIHNPKFPFNYGLGISKEEEYRDLRALAYHVDVKDTSWTFYFNTSLLSRKEQIKFVLYRSNLTIDIDWKDKSVNQFEIFWGQLPKVDDYHFFENKKAILDEEGLTFLDSNGQPEKTRFSIKTKKRIKISKRKRVKKYLKVMGAEEDR